MKTLRSTIGRKVSFCLLVLSAFSFYTVNAQTSSLYNYGELSHLFYAKQKDSLKKNWVCPTLFKTKETQRMYKDFWEERTQFITGAMEGKNFVHDREIYNYIDNIIGEIVAANPKQIPVKPTLLIDRSASANAYAIGGNIIAVNLGLITFARYREDIAMVIAHELSHNILNHTDNALKERAEWLTSDDYKKSVNAVLDSKYERLSRLKKVFEGYSFNRSRHQRYKEGDADSLAVVLLKNTKIPFDASFYLRLDSSDIQYKQPLHSPVKTYFTAFNLPFEDMWTQKRSKGLSTKSYNFKDTTNIEDSLKTHPDCKDRYAKCLPYNTPNLNHASVPTPIQDKANKMLIWNMFDNQALTACLYRIMLEKDKGNKDEWYDFMMHNVISGLYYSDRQLSRFNAIGVTQKEYISKDYYELQTMLEQIPREKLEQYCKSLSNSEFWQKMPSDAKGLKSFMYSLNFQLEPNDVKSVETAAKEYAGNYSNSMYCEFADHFKRK